MSQFAPTWTPPPRPRPQPAAPAWIAAEAVRCRWIRELRRGLDPRGSAAMAARIDECERMLAGRPQ